MRARLSARAGAAAGGQVLVLSALGMVIFLGFAALAIDIGRQLAERRYVQNAADAAALAGCQALIDGASDAAAAQAARDIGLVNLANSPVASTSSIAPDDARLYEAGHAGDPAYLRSGIIVSGSSVRVAIRSTLATTVGRVLGMTQLETGGRARCLLEGFGLPIVARRYVNAPGPGSGFIDHLASEATSGSGGVDATNVLGYDGRTPASEAQPGPVFALYGPQAKASNAADFRGFIALDIRNFASTNSRVYYNGVPPGTNPDTLKDEQGEYILTGYPGPAFAPISTPPDPNDQVAVMDGNNSAMVPSNFDDRYDPGDRVLIGVYNGTVMEIPDFSLTMSAPIDVPGTGTLFSGPTFTVSRNDAFTSTVTLMLRGDHDAAAAIPPQPTYDLIPPPESTLPPTPGHMNVPTFTPNVFLPDRRGTTVRMSNITTLTVPPGIYTVWLEGKSGDPYFQTRRVPVSVRVGGARKDFSLVNSQTVGSTATLGGTISLPIYLSTTSPSATRWGGGPVALSIDAASLPAGMTAGQITFSPALVTPSTSGSGALSTMTISTGGLPAGSYTVTLRATGTNGDAQPVTHLQPVTFNVATAPSGGSYVDIIGFAVFKVTSIDSNDIYARAVTGVYADPNDPALRRGQVARLVPWQ